MDQIFWLRTLSFEKWAKLKQAGNVIWIIEFHFKLSHRFGINFCAIGAGLTFTWFLTMRKIQQFLFKLILKLKIIIKKLLKENLPADQTHVWQISIKTQPLLSQKICPVNDIFPISSGGYPLVWRFSCESLQKYWIRACVGVS